MVAPNLTHTPEHTRGQASRLQTIRRLQRGQSLAEVALSLTVLLLLVSGIVDLGRAFFAKIAMDNMISEGAHWATAYPACIPYAQNATNASQVPVNCRGTNSIIGRMINENKDLDRTRITDMSVTPQNPGVDDQVFLSITYQVPTITPVIRMLFGPSLPITVTATEMKRGDSVPDFAGGPMTQPPNLSPIGSVGNISYVCTNGSAVLSWGVVPASGYHVYVGSTQVADIPQPPDPSVVSITWTDPVNRPGFGGGITYGVTAYNNDGATPTPHIVDSNQRLKAVSCSSIKPGTVVMSCTPLGATFTWTMATPLDTAVKGYQILRYQQNPYPSGPYTYKTMGTVSDENTWMGAINFDANPPDGTALYQIQPLTLTGSPPQWTAIGPKSDTVGGVKVDGSPYCPPTTADLSISVTGNPDPYVVVGSPLMYTVKVTNIGPLTATGTTVTQNFAPSVILDPGTPLPPSCLALSPQQVKCVIGDVPKGNTSLSIGVIPQAIGPIITTATVRANEPDPTNPDPDNNPATSSLTTSVTDHPNLAISMSGAPATVAVGNTITYSIRVSTENDIYYVNPIVTDTIPAGLSVKSCIPGCTKNSPVPGQVTFNSLGLLSPGMPITLTLVLDVPSNYIPTVPAGCSFTSGCIQNSVSVAPVDTIDSSNNYAFVTTPVVDLQMGSLTNSPSSVAAGSYITYTMSVQNIGPDANNVSVSFTYPYDPSTTNMTLVTTGPGATSPNCSGSNGMITCTIGTMAAGTTSSPLTLMFAVPTGYTGPTTFPSMATVLPSDPTPNNTATVMTTVLVPDLEILVPTYTTSVQAGSNGNNGNNVTYNIQVSNKGTAAADNVRVVETLPLGVSFDAAANPGWQFQSGSTYFYQLGTMNPGSGPINVTLVVGVKNNYGNGTPISNTLTVTPTDPNSSNNSYLTNVTVTAPQIWGASGVCTSKGNNKYAFQFNWSGYPLLMWNVQQFVVSSNNPNVSWSAGTATSYFSGNSGIPLSAGPYNFTITAYNSAGAIASSAVNVAVTCYP